MRDGRRTVAGYAPRADRPALSACLTEPVPRFTTNDGVSLAYTDRGEGRPVVLVNGYTAPATAWALTEDALLAAGFRVIAFDRRSSGESETTWFGQRMARHGRDLGELLSHLGLADVTLVGASMGGNAIWAYVDQFGTETLAGVVVVDQTPKMLNSEDWPHGFYGYDASNAGTLFAHGVPARDHGRPLEESRPAIMRLVERLGAMPAYRDPAAPETLGLLADHPCRLAPPPPLPPGLAVRARRPRPVCRPPVRAVGGHRGQRARDQHRPATSASTRSCWSFSTRPRAQTQLAPRRRGLTCGTTRTRPDLTKAAAGASPGCDRQAAVRDRRHAARRHRAAGLPGRPRRG